MPELIIKINIFYPNQTENGQMISPLSPIFYLLINLIAIYEAIELLHQDKIVLGSQ